MAEAAEAAAEDSAPVTLMPVTRTQRRVLGAISVVALAAVVGVWVGSDARQSSLEVVAEAPAAVAQPTTLPSAVTELGRIDVATGIGPVVPQVVGTTVVLPTATTTATAVDPSTLNPVWSYTRANRELCAVTSAFSKASVIARGPRGCGEITQISPEGDYVTTYSSRQDDAVATVVSNAHLAVVGPSQVSLHRDDLVETLRYGDDPAPQEPHMQPRSGCEVQSVGTRRSVLAIIDQCEGESGAHLRVQNTTPEDRRKPEEQAVVDLGTPQARVLAVDTEAIVVLTETSELIRISPEGTELSRQQLAESVTLPPVEAGVVTADAPHAITAFVDGQLFIFRPSSLDLQAEVPSIGIGAPVGTEQLIIPTSSGFAGIRLADGEQVAEIAVARAGTPEWVHVAWANGVLVERQPAAVVAYRPVP